MPDQKTLIEDEVTGLITSWDRHLTARNLAKKTRRSYLESARSLTLFLQITHGRPITVEDLSKSAVESFISDVLDQWKATTASVRYKSLQQFFKWLVLEGEIDSSPMALMTAPIIPEELPKVRTDDEIRSLLKSCEGREFAQRRDAAIIRLFLDTGMRADALTAIQVDGINFEENSVTIIHKGRREQKCFFGPKTAAALDRYLRVRARHKRASEAALWLGDRNRKPMTYNGIHGMIQRRGKAVGIPDLHPHELRHTFAHNWLAGGGNEGDLMTLAGWRSRAMLDRYAKSAAAERARQAHIRLGIGERF